ncbi:MAG: 5-methylthioadenosine/S-adenosylhomocysteine deaminase [Rhodospirillaceae bacterium]|jgi:5-methylthioadenosine/S-adenosylhomocysteine deaminase|nr:5-methylthioadenosine/S-adenosylhomocysteine deaminase [Rhodospirillaceae bacterium]
MPVLIANGHLVTGDTADTRLPRGDVLIDGNRIVRIGCDLRREAATLHPELEIIDASNSIVMPGLVNAHVHSNEGFEQGAYDNLPLELWLLESYPPWGMPRFSERQHYLRTMLTAIEAIRSGTTTLQDDLLHFLCTPEGVDGAAKAYRDAGLRAFITVTMWNRPLVESLPFGRELIPAALQVELAAAPPPSIADILGLFRQHFANWHGHAGRLGIVLGPSGTQRCTDDLLMEVTELSARHGIGVHSHVLETRTQAVTAQQLYGKTMVEHMHDLGMLTPRLTINHGIWLTEREIDLLGTAGCSVTHNPLSNLKLGSGICPVRRLLQAGANVALGTDGLTTSDTGDMVEALRAAALLHKIGAPDYDAWITAGESFAMATMGGACSCLAQAEIGSIEVGKRADIILLDRSAWGFIPLHDPVRQLAFSVTSEAVTHTIVDGRILMRDRKITVLDEVAIKAEVSDCAERFRREDMPKMRAGAARLAPYIAEIYHRAMATPLPGNFGAARRGPPIGMASASS